jgi:hypothetical protein
MHVDAFPYCIFSSQLCSIIILFGLAVCHWDGIKCSGGEIYELNLENTQLIASIPEALGTVTSIRNLYLGECWRDVKALMQISRQCIIHQLLLLLADAIIRLEQALWGIA